MINKTNDNGDNSGGMPDDPLPDNGEKEKETLRDEDETPRGDSENERRDKHLLWVIRQQDKIIICLAELGRRIQRLEYLMTLHVGEKAAREIVLALLHDLGFQPQQPLLPADQWATLVETVFSRYLDTDRVARQLFHSRVATMVGDGSLLVRDGRIVICRGHMEEFLRYLVDAMSAATRYLCQQARRQHTRQRNALTKFGDYLADHLTVLFGDEERPACVRSLTAQVGRILSRATTAGG